MKSKFINLLSKFYVVLTLCLVFSQIEAAQPKVLYSSSNVLYGPLWVYEIGEKRCLSFIPPGRGVVQSCIYKNNPKQLISDYTKMLLSTLYINKNPQRILMIGLGGAVVSNALNKLVPTTKLDIVEINPDIVLFVTKQYFFFNPNSNTNIFIQDGYDFIKNSAANSYDIIIVDAFTKDYVPPAFLTLEFVENIKKCLKPNGVVAVNTFLKRSNSYYKLESKLYKTVFKNLFELISSRSRVILARNGPLPTIDQIKQESVDWDKSFQIIGIDSTWLVNMF